MTEKEKLELKEEIFNDLIDYNSLITNALRCITDGIQSISNTMNIISIASANLNNYLNSNFSKYPDYAKSYLTNELTNVIKKNRRT